MTYAKTDAGRRASLGRDGRFADTFSLVFLWLLQKTICKDLSKLMRDAGRAWGEMGGLLIPFLWSFSGSCKKQYVRTCHLRFKAGVDPESDIQESPPSPFLFLLGEGGKLYTEGQSLGVHAQMYKLLVFNKRLRRISVM